MNKIIVQASNSTVASYGVAKCTENLFERGKMVKGETLQVLQERMKTMEANQNKIYKFLGAGQVDGKKSQEVTRSHKKNEDNNKD